MSLPLIAALTPSTTSTATSSPTASTAGATRGDAARPASSAAPTPEAPTPAPINPAPKFLPFRAQADGAPLAMRLYDAAGASRDRPRGAVMIAPAMGVPQKFYAPLAGWLAERGFAVMSFDYRGSGDSRSAPLRELDVDVMSWARHDAAAALSELVDHVSGHVSGGAVPITWIGHSLGGQIVPMIPNRAHLAKIVTIATGSGYWRENSPALRRKVWLFWWLAAPALTPLFGYFPGRALRMVGDLPRGVIEQWRRWCLHPEYCVGAEGQELRAAFDAVTTPLTSISFTDDEMMSEQNTASLHGFYRNAPRTMTRLAPLDHGLARVGHFGFFRPEVGSRLWASQLLPALALGS